MGRAEVMFLLYIHEVKTGNKPVLCPVPGILVIRSSAGLHERDYVVGFSHIKNCSFDKFENSR